MALAGPLLATPLGGCLARPDAITNVIGIPVVEGANPITHLVPDGRSGLIVEGSLAALRRPDAILVLLPRLSPERGWDVVGIEDRDTGRVSSTLPDPGEGEDARFARAKVGGDPATLMFVAYGNGADGRPSRFTIDTYRLSTGGEDGLGLPAVFDPIGRTTTRRSYCSAEAALVDVERLDPEPGTATGRRDGCGADAAS